MLYLKQKYGGVGLKSIKNEVMVQYIRKGLYLIHNQDLQNTSKRYNTLKKAGYRTPIGELDYVVGTLGPQLMEYSNNMVPLSKFIRHATQKAQELIQEQLLNAWAESCHYGRLIKKYYSSVEFPAINSIVD